MSSLFKYRVHEVAKDFNMTSKQISQILSDYETTPKNHMQVLTDRELNLIFDYITQHNQVDDIAKYFAAAEKAVKQKPAPAPEEAPAAVVNAAAGAQKSANTLAEKSVKTAPEKTAPLAPKPAATQANRKNQGNRPQQPTVTPTPQQTKEQATIITSNEHSGVKGGSNVHIIDTRGGPAVNLAKYDDKVDKLVPDKAKKLNPGKEKFKRTPDRGRGPQQRKRYNEQDKLRRIEIERIRKQPIKVSIPDEISVGELALRLKKTGAEVVKTLIKLGIMASLSEIIDYDTATLVALEFGAKVEHEIHVTIEEILIDESQDQDENLVTRSPVVVVMGHVDHGKTSLLDYIRNSKVTAGEAGGITQHIGAYSVDYNGNKLTFLDTPGHAAFTSMRARGANVTDIAILVVAADDGIMPQTIEAINHAKAADVPIIVAINKMDKETANPERIMQQLTEHTLIPEEWGGETIVCKVSSKTGEGMENLLEMLLLTAEMKELKANPNRRAFGAVIEARLDKSRGPVATILVQNGTLNSGDVIIAGTSVGRVRVMTDYRGNKIEQAGPSTPVEITGLSEVPEAGDHFNAVEDERMARELVEERKIKEREASQVTSKVTLDDLFAQIKEGEIKDLNIVLKADVQGSAEALKTSLEKIENEEARVRVIHRAVGAVNESDVLLASTASAIIVGFNVRSDASAAENAKRNGVDIRYYRVIYEAIEEIESAMKGLLAPKYEEEVLGQALVRQTFHASNIGTIAGSYVQTGKILRNAQVRIIRDGIVVHEGTLSSLKRFKDDAREVSQNYECGITVEDYNDIKEGDIIEAFRMVEIAH